MNIFAFYCKQNGIDVMSKPMVTTFPEQNKPLMEVEQVLSEYQDQYHEIMKKHGLDYLDGARAGMIVCSIMFQYHYAVSKILIHMSPQASSRWASLKVQRQPLRLWRSVKLDDPSTNAKRSIHGGRKGHCKEFHQRFRNKACIGRADDIHAGGNDNGGNFIDINPGVLEL